MPETEDEQAFPKIRSSLASLHLLFEEGGLGLAAVIAYVVMSFVTHVFAAAFSVPPPWFQFLHLLLPIVAIVSWSGTRVWIYESGRLAKNPSPTSGVFLALSQTFAVLHVKELPREQDPSARRHRPLLVPCLIILLGLAVFTAYFITADVYTFASVQPDASPKFESGEGIPTTAPSMASMRFVFPLFQTDDKFKTSLELRGGRTYVVDNDSYWLADRLKDDDVSWGVLATKLLLMFLLLLATSLVIIGTTLLSSLRKPKVGLHDALEGFVTS
jgi:hypothetical protein